MKYGKPAFEKWKNIVSLDKLQHTIADTTNIAKNIY